MRLQTNTGALVGLYHRIINNIYNMSGIQNKSCNQPITRWAQTYTNVSANHRLRFATNKEVSLLLNLLGHKIYIKYDIYFVLRGQNRQTSLFVYTDQRGFRNENIILVQCLNTLQDMVWWIYKGFVIKNKNIYKALDKTLIYNIFQWYQKLRYSGIWVPIMWRHTLQHDVTEVC